MTKAMGLAAGENPAYRKAVPVRERFKKVRNEIRLRQGARWKKVGLRGALFLTLGVVAVVAVIASVVLFLPTFVVGSDLGDKRIGNLDEPELLKAKNDVRTTLLQGIGGSVLLLGAYLTWRQIQVTREGQREEAYLNREGQITERFTRAIDQLGAENIDVRLGGIYALERVAKDSGADHGPVMEVLTAFLREHSPRDQEAGNADRLTDEVPANPYLEKFEQIYGPRSASDLPMERPRTDLQAAAAVIGRRNIQNDPPGHPLFLTRVRLPQAFLADADLQHADLIGADLRGTALQRSNLERAWLPTANLKAIVLHEANLHKAVLEKADLRDADLALADLTGANLTDADLTRADLTGANLRDADLTDADLTDADLTGADLTGARANDETKWPDHFEPTAAGVSMKADSSQGKNS